MLQFKRINSIELVFLVLSDRCSAFFIFYLHYRRDSMIEKIMRKDFRKIENIIDPSNTL